MVGPARRRARRGTIANVRQPVAGGPSFPAMTAGAVDTPTNTNTGTVRHVGSGQTHATIAAGVAAAVAGDTVLVHAGVYREAISASTGVADVANLIIQNAPGEYVEVCGANVYTTWTASGANWFKAVTTPWPTIFTVPNNAIAGYPEQVFVDDVQLTQVASLASATTALTPGTFYYDRSGALGNGVGYYIRVASGNTDVNTRTVEIADIDGISSGGSPLTLRITAAGVKVRGIAFRKWSYMHANTFAPITTTEASSNALFEDCIFEYFAQGAIFANGPQSTGVVTVRRCDFKFCGRYSMYSDVVPVIFDSCYVEQCNYLHFDGIPAAGGIKLAGQNGGTAMGSYSGTTVTENDPTPGTAFSTTWDDAYTNAGGVTERRRISAFAPASWNPPDGRTIAAGGATTTTLTVTAAFTDTGSTTFTVSPAYPGAGAGNEVRDSFFKDCWGNTIWLDVFADDAVIARNYIVNSAATRQSGSAQIFYEYSDHGWIVGNICNGGYYGIKASLSSYVEVWNNVIYDCEGPLHQFYNARANSASDIYAERRSPTKGLRWRNNVIIASSGSTEPVMKARDYTSRDTWSAIGWSSDYNAVNRFNASTDSPNFFRFTHGPPSGPEVTIVNRTTQAAYRTNEAQELQGLVVDGSTQPWLTNPAAGNFAPVAGAAILGAGDPSTPATVLFNLAPLGYVSGTPDIGALQL